MTAKSVIETFVRLFNNQDYNALAELYTDDAVNHQVAKTLYTEKVILKNVQRFIRSS